MLPSFQKAQKILDEEWRKRMFAAKDEVFPHSVHPPVLSIVEGKDADYQREDGKIMTLDIKLHKTSISQEIKDGRGMTLESFDQKARETGNALGNQMWDMLLGAFDAAVKEAGNEIQIKKGKLNQDDILRMLEMAEHNFDEKGKSTNQLILGPEIEEEFKKRTTEWAEDAVFQAKVADIQRRKKEDFNEREARRRLVD